MRGTARLAHSQNPPPPTISDFSDRLLGWTAFVPPAALSFQRNRIFACHTTWQSLLRMLMVGVAEVDRIDFVKYYAHTAVSPDGTKAPSRNNLIPSGLIFWHRASLLVGHSPLRGCSLLAPRPAPKSPRHIVSRYFWAAPNDPKEERWQLLSTHLSNVASLAKQFAAPLNLTEEAGLAGFLHDL
jgi:hypothetical protein